MHTTPTHPQVEQVNERLLEKRTAAIETMDAYEEKLASAPSWWPSIGNPTNQKRVRAAEKVVLEEIAGQKQLVR